MFSLVLFQMMVPGQIFLLPQYQIVQKLGLLDTIPALFLPNLFSAFGTFLLRQFFMSLPKELEEAAIVDGCGRFRIFAQIMLPLIKPATFSVGLLVFINCWNEYLYSLTFMSKDSMRTVPVGIALFPSNYQLPWGDMAAASIVCTLPLIVLVLVFQKNIVAGLTKRSFFLYYFIDY